MGSSSCSDRLLRRRSIRGREEAVPGYVGSGTRADLDVETETDHAESDDDQGVFR